MVCVSAGAGVDSVREQEKLEATLREMLVNRADFHTSGARFVGHGLEDKTAIVFYALSHDLPISSYCQPY